MRFSLLSSGVLVDGVPLPAEMDAIGCAAMAGAEISTRSIRMHPSGTRHATVGANGIVWYLDEPEGRVSHFYLAIVPGETPEDPPVRYGGEIDLAGWELDAERTESIVLDRCGWALEGPSPYWSYRTRDHFVTLVFARHRDRRGRKAGARKLAHVSVSFERHEGD